MILIPRSCMSLNWTKPGQSAAKVFSSLSQPHVKGRFPVLRLSKDTLQYWICSYKQGNEHDIAVKRILTLFVLLIIISCADITVCLSCIKEVGMMKFVIY